MTTVQQCGNGDVIISEADGFSTKWPWPEGSSLLANAGFVDTAIAQHCSLYAEYLSDEGALVESLAEVGVAVEVNLEGLDFTVLNEELAAEIFVRYARARNGQATEAEAIEATDAILAQFIQ